MNPKNKALEEVTKRLEARKQEQAKRLKNQSNNSSTKSNVLENMKRDYEASKKPKKIELPKTSTAWPETDKQKNEYQRRFGRAWND